MNPNFKHQHHHTSLKSALSGLGLALSREINMKIIVVAAVAIAVLGIFMQISYLEWLAVIISIFFVLLSEMINTSVEAICDLVTLEWHKDVKNAKDISSGMVLLASLGAAVIGLIIFLPKILWLIF